MVFTLRAIGVLASNLCRVYLLRLVGHRQSILRNTSVNESSELLYCTKYRWMEFGKLRCITDAFLKYSKSRCHNLLYRSLTCHHATSDYANPFYHGYALSIVIFRLDIVGKSLWFVVFLLVVTIWEYDVRY